MKSKNQMYWDSVLEDSGSYSPILIFRLCRIFLFAVWSIVYRSRYCQVLSNVAKWTAPNDLCEGFMDKCWERAKPHKRAEDTTISV